MPPEVLRGKQYTYSVDYWSLGCILFEFLSVSARSHLQYPLHALTDRDVSYLLGPATLPSLARTLTRRGQTSRTGSLCSPDRSTPTRRTSSSTWATRPGTLSLGQSPSSFTTVLLYHLNTTLTCSRLRPLHCLHRLIAGDKVRISDLRELQTQPFFSGLPFSNLRETQAPFVPALESECDVGYYDDFTNQEDLAKYGTSPPFCPPPPSHP